MVWIDAILEGDVEAISVPAHGLNHPSGAENLTVFNSFQLPTIQASPSSQSHCWQKLADIPEERFEMNLRKPKCQRRIVGASGKPRTCPVSADALWLWGPLRDFERDGLLAKSPQSKSKSRRVWKECSQWIKGRCKPITSSAKPSRVMNSGRPHVIPRAAVLSLRSFQKALLLEPLLQNNHCHC